MSMASRARHTRRVSSSASGAASRPDGLATVTELRPKDHLNMAHLPTVLHALDALAELDGDHSRDRVRETLGDEHIIGEDRTHGSLTVGLLVLADCLLQDLAAERDESPAELLSVYRSLNGGTA